MKYIGKKFGHYYFQDENYDIFEISPVSEDVHYCCNKQSGPHDYADDFYSSKHTVDTLDKIDLVELRVNYLLEREKVTFAYAGSLDGNKYFLDNFNNVFGFNKAEPKEVYVCGIRKSRDFRLADLKDNNCLELKREISKLNPVDLKNNETPKNTGGRSKKSHTRPKKSTTDSKKSTDRNKKGTNNPR